MNTAFLTRHPSKVFLRVPNEPGRWVLTDRCCAEVACSHCGAEAGEPCHDGKRERYTTGTHYARRVSWKWGRSPWKQTPSPESSEELALTETTDLAVGLPRLRELAGRATKGPWQCVKYNQGSPTLFKDTTEYSYKPANVEPLRLQVARDERGWG